jgi:DNA repair ATPase RecN
MPTRNGEALHWNIDIECRVQELEKDSKKVYTELAVIGTEVKQICKSIDEAREDLKGLHTINTRLERIETAYDKRTERVSKLWYPLVVILAATALTGTAGFVMTLFVGN